MQSGKHNGVVKYSPREAVDSDGVHAKENEVGGEKEHCVMHSAQGLVVRLKHQEAGVAVGACKDGVHSTQRQHIVKVPNDEVGVMQQAVDDAAGNDEPSESTKAEREEKTHNEEQGSSPEKTP